MTDNNQTITSADVEVTPTPTETESTKTVAELELELAKYKKSFDKVSSELSQTKKLYKDKLTEEEKKQAEQQELQEALMTELETLRKEKKVALITAKVTDLGVEGAVASKMAEFYASEDTESFFGLLKAFVNDLKEQIRIESMKGQPSPQGGGQPTPEEPDFAKMSLDDINEYFKKQGVVK